jgi:microcystin degradation protein MlrC
MRRHLKGLVEAGVDRVAFHAICDPQAVQDGIRAGVGPGGSIVVLRTARIGAWPPLPGQATFDRICPKPDIAWS